MLTITRRQGEACFIGDFLLSVLEIRKVAGTRSDDEGAGCVLFQIDFSPPRQRPRAVTSVWAGYNQSVPLGEGPERVLFWVSRLEESRIRLTFDADKRVGVQRVEANERRVPVTTPELLAVTGSFRRRKTSRIVRVRSLPSPT
ncbi:MAG: hypothetical protein J0M12_06070 [Deltaproteobacteria bacterium]|nr:hypothetical protein [Deltaproteobacteria bacterium]